MPDKRVLAERLKTESKLRKQDERWERIRRREDREERKIKDEELNGVRLQLRDQAAGFATKDMLFAADGAIDAKIDAAVASLEAKIEATFNRLNDEGTEGFRESEATRRGRDEILASTASNRRWLVGVVVTVILFGIAQGISLALFVAHILLTNTVG